MNPRHRAIGKTFTWRVLATLTTLIISFVVTGSLEAATIITTLEIAIKTVLYYVHERQWDKIEGKG